MKIALVMILCNGPIAAIFALDLLQGGRSERSADKALSEGRCQARDRFLPGGRCDQQAAATVEVFEGYEYRFFRCLCEDHATDAHRRMRGRAYRVSLLTRQDA